MIPELIFKYSSPYNRNWARALDKTISLEEIEVANKFVKAFKEKFDSEKVLDLLSKEANLEWKFKKILVYFVLNLPVSGFSDPLTIRIDKNLDLVNYTLIHELTHIILIQNQEIVRDKVITLKDKFPAENKSVITHLIVLPLAEKVFKKIYGEEKFIGIEKIIRNYKGLKKPYELLD